MYRSFYSLNLLIQFIRSINLFHLFVQFISKNKYSFAQLLVHLFKQANKQPSNRKHISKCDEAIDQLIIHIPFLETCCFFKASTTVENCLSILNVKYKCTLTVMVKPSEHIRNVHRHFYN